MKDQADQARTPAISAEWRGILDEDEKIVWQGAPDAKIIVTPSILASSAFGIFFAGFAFFWMLGAARAGGQFWMFGLLHFFVGLSIILGPFLIPAWKRRHTFYTLTNRRAFIAKDLPFYGRSLKSYPIVADTPLDLVPGPRGSVYFATDTQRRRKQHETGQIGFERISDAQEVYALLRDIQRNQNGQTQPSAPA